MLSRGHERPHENYYCLSVRLSVTAVRHGSGHWPIWYTRSARPEPWWWGKWPFWSEGTSHGHGRLMGSRLQREDQGEIRGTQVICPPGVCRLDSVEGHGEEESPAQGQPVKRSGKAEVVEGSAGQQGQHGSGDTWEGKGGAVWTVWGQLQAWV